MTAMKVSYIRTEASSLDQDTFHLILILVLDTDLTRKRMQIKRSVIQTLQEVVKSNKKAKEKRQLKIKRREVG